MKLEEVFDKRDFTENADSARRDICKYGKDNIKCEIYYDWFADHSEKLGYDSCEIFDLAYYIFDDIRYAKCKAHFLAPAIHNYDFAQTSNEKRTAVICFGEGYHIAKHISHNKIASYKCYDTRLALQNIFDTDKYLNKEHGMTKEDFFIEQSVTKGLGCGNNEELAKKATDAMSDKIEKHIKQLKENGVKKIIVITDCWAFGFYAAELVYKVCKRKNLLCDIYAFTLEELPFPEISLSERRLNDLQENFGAEILLYPSEDIACLFENVSAQYAKTIEYTCL